MNVQFYIFVIILLVLRSFLQFVGSSIIYSDGTDVKNSMVEIHGLEKSDPKYIICIGVGTCLSVKNYRRLAERIVSVIPNALTVILDPNPSGRGFFNRLVYPGIVKFRASDFASAFSKASSWINSSNYRRKTFEWYVGGHSSSGQGAYSAVARQDLKEKISGYIGLDPCCIFNIVNEPLLVSSIIWTTSDPFANCVPSKIAGAGFHKSILSSAIGKQLQISHSLFRFTDKSKHCIFSDDGCPVFGCTGVAGSKVTEAHNKVARSIKDFVTGQIFKSEDYPEVSITTNTVR